MQSVFVCEAFVELLEEARQRRPALDVRYSVMSSVTRNISALQVFQVSLERQVCDIIVVICNICAHVLSKSTLKRLFLCMYTPQFKV